MKIENQNKRMLIMLGTAINFNILHLAQTFGWGFVEGGIQMFSEECIPKQKIICLFDPDKIQNSETL